MTTKLIRKAKSSIYRVLDFGIPVPSPSLFPTNEAEFLHLLDTAGIKDEKTRESYLLLWGSGAVILYLEWNNSWGSKNGAYTLQEMVRQFDYALGKQQLAYKNVAEQTRKGKLDIDQWEAQMKEAIEDAHYTAALLVFGPLFLQIPEVREILEGSIAVELNYLTRLANGLRDGSIRMDGNFKRRTGMYLQAARKTLWSLARLWARITGKRFEENVLGHAEHCEGSGSCVEQTERGRVPLGSLIPIGSRLCLTACQCMLVFS